MIVDYTVGRGIERSDDDRRRKLLLTVSLVSQLGILAFFKYFNFFVDSAADMLERFGMSVDPSRAPLRAAGRHQLLHVPDPGLRRSPCTAGSSNAEHDLMTFAAFVAWFPQLVAGPIERATSLLPQIRVVRRPPPAPVVESGVLLILRGLFKKIVIADGVATFVNTVYTNSSAYSWSALVLASIGFAVQVYGDFSGYSDIARGTSRLLGVELRWNFEQPFLSRDMREFWTRWHTSLGWWFTEHVGRPLGGTSGGKRPGLHQRAHHLRPHRSLARAGVDLRRVGSVQRCPRRDLAHPARARRASTR